ncbi:MAG: acyl-CoA dehydratase activase [Oscillospiraceae bacterium]|nr:acyl-CoA dehydratase activase [Oscillospiraceae bacterium]
MFVLGVDIGSSASKCVILRIAADDAADSSAAAATATAPVVISTAVAVGGAGTGGPGRAIDAALEDAGISDADLSKVAATGYGRNTFERADVTFSELSCHAKGAVFIMPGVRTVIDIGGQDCKAMQLDASGRLENFAMNDKCAAGTGRFLEVMARVLEIGLPEMGRYGEEAESVIEITSTCTVFAESEVISQLSKGADKRALVAGIHRSVAAKAASIAKRLKVVQPIFFTGGVSQNTAVVKALARELKADVQTAPSAQLAGALGAALMAQ